MSKESLIKPDNELSDETKQYLTTESIVINLGIRDISELWDDVICESSISEAPRYMVERLRNQAKTRCNLADKLERALDKIKFGVTKTKQSL